MSVGKSNNASGNQHDVVMRNAGGSEDLRIAKKSLALQMQRCKKLEEQNEQLTQENQTMSLEIDVLGLESDLRTRELEHFWQMYSQAQADVIYWKEKFDLVSAQKSMLFASCVHFIIYYIN